MSSGNDDSRLIDSGLRPTLIAWMTALVRIPFDDYGFVRILLLLFTALTELCFKDSGNSDSRLFVPMAGYGRIVVSDP